MIVRWTEDAAEDLRRIFQYIAKDDANAATRVCLRIVDSIDLLTSFPRKGRVGRVARTRELVASGLPCLTVYEVADEVIFILRILHGAVRRP
jgi:plasmid stabilization system protein ParE